MDVTEEIDQTSHWAYSNYALLLDFRWNDNFPGFLGLLFRRQQRKTKIKPGKSGLEEFSPFLKELFVQIRQTME